MPSSLHLCRPGEKSDQTKVRSCQFWDFARQVPESGIIKVRNFFAGDGFASEGCF
jgi:hypothetical protein